MAPNFNHDDFKVRFRHGGRAAAAFYNDGLKSNFESQVGLAAAKTAAMRINLNIYGCGIVAFS